MSHNVTTTLTYYLIIQTPENIIACDEEFLKGQIIEIVTLMNEFSTDEITNAIYRIPEFFTIVMQEKMLNQ